MANNPFVALFQRSPFKPLIEHIEQTALCADLLQQFYQATLNQDWIQASKLQKEISLIENRADDLKMQVRLNLPTTIFMPVARSDLLELITLQDRLANCCRDIVGIMLGRRMQTPPSLVENMKSYLATACAAVKKTQEALIKLNALLESGFGRNVTQILEAILFELNALEHQTDKQEIVLRAQLFELEKQLEPVDVMFFYHLIDNIGELADGANRVGTRLQILLNR